MFIKNRRFFDLPMSNNGNLWVPAELAHDTVVTLSLDTLNPLVAFSWQEANDFLCSAFSLSHFHLDCKWHHENILLFLQLSGISV